MVGEGDSCAVPDRASVRFPLTTGRKCKDAARTFRPYRKVKEVNQEARQGGADLIEEAIKVR